MDVRIKYFSKKRRIFCFSFLLITLIISFLLGMYDSHSGSWHVIETNEMQKEMISHYHYIFRTHFTDIPDFDTFLLNIAHIEIRRQLYRVCEERDIELWYYYEPWNKKICQSFDEFNASFFRKFEWEYIFNTNTFIEDFIILGLIPLTIFELLFMLYYNVVYGRLAETYIGLLSRRFKLQYKVKKILERQRIQALENKLKPPQNS